MMSQGRRPCLRKEFASRQALGKLNNGVSDFWFCLAQFSISDPNVLSAIRLLNCPQRLIPAHLGALEAGYFSKLNDSDNRMASKLKATAEATVPKCIGLHMGKFPTLHLGYSQIGYSQIVRYPGTLS